MKKTMKLTRTLACLLLAACTVVCAVACTGGEDVRLPTLPAALQAPEPIPYDEIDYEALMSGTMQEAREASLDELSYTLAADGTLTLHAYTGTATAVRLPENVVAIDGGAFANNETLEVLVLPDGLRSMGEGILKGCTSLRALQTPLLAADASQEGYLGYLFGAASYRDNARDVPASLEMVVIGKGARSLPDFAMYDCNDLICVGLPKDLTVLGSHAFFGCLSLKYLPTRQLTAVGDHAMALCTSLVSISFGESLESLGIGALEGCKALRELTLPFVGGSHTENAYLGYVFGASSPDFAKGYYPARLQKITLLPTCKTLGNYAFFECESLRELQLSETLTSVGVRAFADCDGLSSLVFPDSVKTIRENAFTGCDRLQDVTLSNALEELGINAFYGCVSLAQIRLPDSLGSLPASCFANCISLHTVSLGGVRTVGKNAFHNCVALRTLAAGAGVTWEKGNEHAEALLK